MEANGAADPPLYLISKAVNFGTGTEDAATLIATSKRRASSRAASSWIRCIRIHGRRRRERPRHGDVSHELPKVLSAFWLLRHAAPPRRARRECGTQERGHSYLIGNVDVRILCERPDNRQASLEWVKVKDGPDGLKFRLQLGVVDFGADKHGDPITTLAVRSADEIEADPKQAHKVSVPPQERLLMDTVEQALIDAGKAVRPFTSGPGVRAVAEEEIRSRYYARLAEKADPDEAPDLFRPAAEQSLPERSLAEPPSRPSASSPLNTAGGVSSGCPSRTLDELDGSKDPPSSPVQNGRGRAWTNIRLVPCPG